jgi:hypothetical protein
MADWGNESLMHGLLPPGTIGPTGKNPGGSICDGDEGELNAAIILIREHQCIVMDFGKRVAWVAMSKEDALGLAAALASKAELLEG